MTSINETNSREGKHAIVKWLYLIGCIILLQGFIPQYAYGQDCDAGFSYTTNCNVVTFTPNDTTSELSYTWDFGDGMTSMEEVPEHIYFEESSGSYSYDVTLIVTGNCVPDTVMQTMMINIGALPDVAIESLYLPNQFVHCDATNDAPNFNLQIQNTSTTQPDNSFYIIDWGDGSMAYMGTSIPFETSHLYQQVGLFDITVQVEGNNGCIAQDTFEFFNGSNPGGNIVDLGNTIACVPETVGLSILGTDNNVSGTTYKIWVEDGSGDTTYYNHPPPDQFFYDFTISACDSIFQAQGYEGEFTVSFEATNNCFTKSGETDVVVNSPPQADFEFSPEINCEQGEFLFMNTSIPGNYFLNNIGCTDSLRSNWNISPNSGYIITAGNLTSNDGFSAQFNEAGIYTVTLIVQNFFTGTGCSPDTISKSFCVVPIPEAAFSSSSEFGCLPHIIDFTNESNTLGSCDTTLYTWEVNFLGGECDTLGDWSFVDTFNMNSVNSSIRFDAPGQYEVMLIVDNRCAIDTTRDTITIANNPVITLDSIPDSCDDALVSPSVDTYIACNDTDPPSYEWFFPGADNITTYEGEEPPDIEYVNNTGMNQTYTIILVTTNVCGPDTATQSFTIFPSPEIPDISSNSPVCTGQTLEFMLDNADGLDFQWMGPEAWSSTEEDPQIPNVTPLYTGEYFLTVTDQISGCTNDTTINALVYDLPPVTINPDSTGVCLGQSVTLTASGASTYVWSPDTYLNITTGPTVISTPDIITTIQYMVTGTDDNGCVNSDTAIVSVNPLPTVSAGAPFDFCVNSTTTLFGSPGTPPGNSYWTGPFISMDGTFSPTMSGIVEVTYHYADENMCEDSSSVEICVLDIPQSSFNINTQQGCIPFDVETTNTSNTLDDCTEATYTWSVSFVNGECNDGPGVFEIISGDINSISPTFRFLESGVYEINLTVLNQCDSSTSSQMVTVGEFPEVAIDSIIDYCDIASITPTFQSFDCELPIQSYLWEFPTSTTTPNTSTNPMPGTFTYGVGTHVVELSVTNVCGTTTDTDTFVVLQGPGVDISLSKDFVCLGDTISVINNSTGDSLDFSWTVSPNDVIISDPNSPTPIFDFSGADIGDYQITVMVGNPICNTITQVFDVRVSRPPTPTLDAIDDDCESIMIDPVYGFGIPNDFIDSVLWQVLDNSNTVVFDTLAFDLGIIQINGPGDYTLELTVYNDCEVVTVSQPFSILEDLVALAQLDNDLVCLPNAQITVDNQSTGDEQNYDWTVTSSNGVTISDSSAEEPTFTFADTGEYVICLEVFNDVCGSDNWCDTILVSQSPMVTLDTVPDFCAGASFTPVALYSDTNRIDSVRWDFPGAVPATSTAFLPGSIEYTATGDYTITVTVYNGCGSSTDMVSFSILEEMNALAELDTNFTCLPNAQITVDNQSTGDELNYLWTVDPTGGVTISDSSAEEPTFTFADTGEYVICLEVFNDVCGSDNWCDTILVSQSPMVTLDTVPDFCAGASFTPVALYSDTNRIDSVRWDFPGAVPATSTAFLPGSIEYTATGDYTITVTVYNGCGSSTDMVSFSILEEMNALAELDTNFTCLPNAQITVDNQSTGDELNYLWTVDPTTGVTISDSSAEEPTFTFADTGVYVICLEVFNDVCGSDNWCDTVLISEPPSVSLDSIPDFCAGASFTPVALYSDTNRIDSVRWDFPGAVPATSTAFLPGSIEYTATGDYTITVTVYNGCGSSTDMVSFSILEEMNALAELDTNFTCLPNAQITVENQSTGDELNYLWTVDPTTGVTISDSSAEEPTFTFADTGVYVICLEVFNDVCGSDNWCDTILVSQSPMVTLDTVPDFCAGASFTPVALYSDTNRIDSVRWDFPGAVPATSTAFLPGSIEYTATGDYTITVTVYNGCGSSTDMVSFSILEEMNALAELDTNFTCLPNAQITVDNQSTGDELNYLWTVDPTGGVTISDSSAEEPTFTFADTGEYVICLEVFNDVCGSDNWCDTILVSQSPMVTLDTVPDFCAGASFTPVALYSDTNRIDSVRWDFPGAVPATSTAFLPGSIEYTATGDYTITVTVYNGCGSSTDMVSFSILEEMNALAELDTNFTCLPNAQITVDNQSTGDELNYLWTVDPTGGVTISDSSAEEPTFTFADTGEYVICLEVFNDVCGSDNWCDTILVSQSPMVTLDTVPDFCAGASFTPVALYSDTNRIDSVRWDFPGAVPATSTAFLPGSIEYTATGDYTITVTVYNGCGSSTDMVSFSILEPMQALAELDTNFTCLPNAQITVENQSTGDELNYLWTVDPTTGVTISDSSAEEPTFTFADTGVYVICLEVFNDVCGSDNWCDTVLISEPPSVSLDSIPDFCAGASFTPVALYSDTNRIDSVRWDFPGAVPATSTAFLPGSIEYTATGDYTITVTVYNGCGSSTDMVSFSILEPMQALAALDTTFGCLPDFTIGVDNQSTGDELNYLWTVDPTTGVTISDSSAEEPTFIFADTGVYVICLEVFNDVCGSDNWCDTVLISEPPSVSLDSIPDFCAGASFTPVAMYSDTNRIDSVRWDFPGALPITSTAFLPGEIVYTNTGDYTITVTVYNGCGSSTDSVSFSILEPMQALAALDTTFGCLPDFTIGVDNQSTGDELNYLWTVDPTTGVTISDSSVEEPTFTFADTGVYVICLEVFNDICGSDNWCDTVLISEPPSVSLDSIPDFCAGASFTPVAMYSDTNRIDSVRWDFPGAVPVTSTAFLPGEIVYTNTGDYTIRVTVYNGCGSSTDSVSFSILEPMQALAVLDTTFGCLPDFTIGVDNQSTGDELNYLWTVDPTTGVTISDSSAEEPTFIFADTGVYVICLEVFNDVCGSDNWCDTVLISEPPSVSLDSIPDFCAGASFTPVAMYSDTNRIDSVRWDFPGAVPVTSTAFLPGEIVYTNTGDYTIRVTVYNGCGSSTDSVSFSILEPMQALAALDTTFGCLPDFTIGVDNQSTGDELNYLWTVDPSTGVTISDSSVEEPTFTFADTGVYVICLEVFNDVCGSDNWCDTVLVSQGPSVVLDSLPDFCAGASFTPVAMYSDTNRIDSVLWEFPGAVPATSTAFLPGEIVYTATGDYSVIVTVYNGCGIASDTVSFSILEPMQALAALDTTFGCLPDFTIGVDNQSTGDELNYLWTVDPTTGVTISDSSVEEPTFTFADTGVYVICLEVFNDICGSDNWCDTVLISEPPSVSLDSIPDFCAGASFTPVAMYSDTNRIDSVRWDFPGAVPVTSTAFLPGEIVYTNTGDYTIRVTVYNGCGSSTDSVSFSILEPMQALAALDTTFGCLPDFTIGVDNQSTGDELNYLWTVDPSTGVTISDSSAEEPTFIFADTGVYVICLEVFNDVCGSDNWCDTVLISEPPSVSLDSIPDFCAGASFTPVAMYSDTNRIDSVRWDFPGAVPVTSTAFLPGEIVYTNTGDYTITVTVYNGCGSLTDSVSFSILEPMQALAALDTTFGCLPDFTIGVDNQSTGDELNYLWTVDPTTGVTISDSSVEEPTFTFADTGVYVICLEVFNDICGSDNWCDTVLISEPPSVSLDSIPDFCAGASFTPVAMYSDTNRIDSVRWDFPGAVPVTSTAFLPGEIVYTNTGDYTIRVTVYNGCGSSTDSVSFSILEPMQALAALDTTFGCLPDFTIGVDNQSTGDELNYLWTVDPTTGVTISDSSVEEPTFTFADTGVYVICLEVFNDICGSDNWCDTVLISEPPSVSLDSIPDFCAGASFTPVAMYSDTNRIDSVRWDFPGAVPVTSTAFLPGEIVYTNTGDYTIRVTVYNGCGSSTDSVSFSILEPMQALAALDTTFGCLPDFTIGVDNQSTGDELNYLWTVDPSTGVTISDSSAEEPTFIFADTGVYVICLEVFNDVCGSDNWCDTVLISEPPSVSLDSIPDFCAGASFTPVAMYSDTNRIDSVRWDFPGAVPVTSTAFLPGEIVYTNTGDYTIRVTVYNGCGSSTDSVSFSILEPMQALAALDTTFGCLPDFTIGVDNQSTGDELNYLWTVDPTTGVTISDSSVEEPTFTFADTGVYVICLEVFNDICGSDNWCDTVLISEPPSVSLDSIPDFCAGASFTPVAMYSDTNRIDSVRWDFPGAVPSTSTDFLPGEIVYTATGDYTITVTVYNGCGSSTDMVSFSILEPMQALAVLDTTFGCLPDFTIGVDNQSTGDELNYDWTVAPSTGVTISDSSALEPIFTFADTGVYVICLEVFNDVCGSDNWCDTVLISEPPSVSLDSLPDFCAGASFTPVAMYSDTNRIDSVRWDFPGAVPSTSTAFLPGEIVYTATGDYSVIVTVYNGCGIASDTVSFSILEPMQALAVLDTTFGCLPDFTIGVDNQSTGDELNYLWTVDPTTGVTISDSSALEPIFTFSDTGVYVICLEVFNDVCGSDNWCDTVLVSQGPSVVLDSLPDFCAGASFTPVAMYSDTNRIDSVLWEFPGAVPATSTAFLPGEIVYTATGDYSVIVTVYNGCGIASDTVSFSILEPMQALAVLDTTFGCLPDFTIGVDNQSTGDELNYLWTVDPATGVTISDSSALEPIFTFADTGVYVICLEVFNDVCGSDNWCDTVLVSQGSSVVLDSLPDFCAGASFTPVAMYSDTNRIDSVLWEFPGGTPSMSTDFLPGEIVYNSTGDYDVIATVYNDCGVASDTVSFSILEPMQALAVLDTAFGCLPDFTIGVDNQSTGDELNYLWTVDPATGVTISDSSAEEPTFTFADTGVYVICLEVFNDICGSDTWCDTVLISQPPTVMLDTIPDFCNTASFTPSAVYSDTNRIDSVYWEFPGGTPAFSTNLLPGAISYTALGNYQVTVTVFNGCGSSTDQVDFNILEPIDANASLDDNFGCLPNFELGVTNLSTGDSLNFEWTVTPDVNVSIVNPTDFEPTFIFSDTGLYVVCLEAFNEVCGTDTWCDTIFISQPPTVVFDSIADYCELAYITPIPTYNFGNLGLIDSVSWSFPGGTPLSSNDFFPDSILYQGAGIYTITAEVFNECGMDSFSQSFIIDTIPEIILGPSDTLCVYDSIFQIPPAIPAGGYWTGPGIVDQDLGTFDPAGFPGGQVVTVTYNFEDGECFVSEDKDIYVADPSYVSADTTLGFCATDTCILLEVGTPMSLENGWYEGIGITDSIGVFCPQLIGGLQDSTVIITYYYQEPGTDCIGSAEFPITVYALPIPGIGGLDSLCVDVPVQIQNTTIDGDTYEWFISDGGYYTVTEPIHSFTDTGFFDVCLIATSLEGCVDSTCIEVYVSGPPVAEFVMDTTMGCAILPVTFTNTSIGYQYVSYFWDFEGGDPPTSTLAQPGTILFDQGTTDTTYYITLTAENHCGVDTYTDSIIVFPKPLTNFAASQYSGCTPLTVAFNNFTLGEPDSFKWDMGNGNMYMDSIPPDQIYIAEGSDNEIYDITLIAFNECGSDTLIQQILVKPDSIRAFFSVDETVGCEPFTVSFDNSTAPDSAIVYNWYFDQNDDTSNAVDTSYTFFATGDSITIYTVSLVADNGCARDTFSLDLTVNPAPDVSFESPPVACAEDSVQFFNTSIDDVNGLFWEFGDGNTSTATNPIHLYGLPGIYTVTLTANAVGTGCPGSDSTQILVQDFPEPSLVVSPLFGCPPLVVNIENETMGGVFYTWDFGDGNTDVGPNPGSHTYTESGFYDIILTAIDSFGCEGDTVFSSIHVYPVPLADFEIEMLDSCGLPQEVCMINFSEGALGFDWLVGGIPSTENNPCFIFDAAGTYDVSLIAENEFTCTDMATDQFTVYDEPIALFEGDTVSCLGELMVFNNLSEHADYVFWDYGDGTTDTTWHGTHIYRDTGAYQVTLVVGNGSGCMDTFSLTELVRVYLSPIADFTYEKLEDELGNTYEFIDQSSEDAINFFWEMGDDSTYMTPDVIHRYLSSYPKRITHIVSNMYGCADTAFAEIKLDLLTGLFIPNILEPNNSEDEENTIFLPKGIGLEEYHIAVYARNGQLMWESTELDPFDEGMPIGFWDGTFKGRDMPGGVYVWKVHKAKFLDGSIWQGMEDESGKKRVSNFLYLVR